MLHPLRLIFSQRKTRLALILDEQENRRKYFVGWSVQNISRYYVKTEPFASIRNMQEKSYEVVVWGATGFTGRLVVEYLLGQIANVFWVKTARAIFPPMSFLN